MLKFKKELANTLAFISIRNRQIRNNHSIYTDYILSLQYLFILTNNMCLVPGCKEYHRSHFCKICNDRDSNHFSSNCPQMQMRPMPRQCKVKNCNENHPAHYCKNCHNHDSNHFASDCNFGNAFNSGVRAPHPAKPNRGFHPRDNGDIIGNRQTMIHELENNRRDNDIYERRYDAKRKSCRVRGCTQLHDFHFCKNCNDNNSNHFSSDCPHQRLQRQPIFSQANQQRFDPMKRSRSKEVNNANNYNHRSSTTPKDPQRQKESPSKDFRNFRENNIYLSQGGRINDDYQGLGFRGGNEAKQGSLREAPWAEMLGKKGYFS